MLGATKKDNRAAVASGRSGSFAGNSRLGFAPQTGERTGPNLLQVLETSLVISVFCDYHDTVIA